MRPRDDSIKHGRDIERRGGDDCPAGERQNEERGVEQQMRRCGRLTFAGRHRSGQGGRGMRQPPRQPQKGDEQDRDADRFMELVKLEEREGLQLHMRHSQADDDEGENAQRHDPVKENGNRRVAAAGLHGCHELLLKLERPRDRQMNIVADIRHIGADAKLAALDRAARRKAHRIGLVDRVDARADEMRLQRDRLCHAMQRQSAGDDGAGGARRA